ncbi:MAG: VWA domain-containing protein [Bryocella sp.]
MKCFPAFAMLLLLSPAGAQTTLHVETKLVAITAVVRNKQGELLPGLTKDDFVLKEDGKLQTIRYFSQDNDLPLQLGLMVDTSGSERDYLDEEVSASETFFATMITRPEDKAFLVQFDDNILLKQYLTASIPALRQGLLRLYEPHEMGPNGPGTHLYDAIVGTTQTLTRFMKGRRALVILSDGDDYGSTRTLSDAVEWAQLSDTTIYTVLYGRDDSPFYFGKHAPIQSGHGVMQFLATSTGGRFFKVSRKQPIEAIYAEIAKELRSQYRIGYTPPPSAAMTFHRIELRSKKKHVDVQARTGYLTLPQ